MTLQSHCTLPHLQLVFLCYIQWAYDTSEKNLLSLTAKSHHPIFSFCLRYYWLYGLDFLPCSPLPIYCAAFCNLSAMWTNHILLSSSLHSSWIILVRHTLALGSWTTLAKTNWGRLSRTLRQESSGCQFIWKLYRASKGMLLRPGLRIFPMFSPHALRVESYTHTLTPEIL